MFLKLRQKRMERRLATWPIESEVLKYEAKMRKIKKLSRPKIETSKLVLFIMIAVLGIIIIFCGYFTAQMLAVVALTGAMMDFTPLVALITAVAGEVIVTLGYFAKSKAENTESGITYQRMMNQFNMEKQQQEDDYIDDGVG